jgi:acetyl/propionyl-CoA carboxylase alpha subunit
LLAKLVVWAPDRRHAIARVARALRDFAIVGVTTNLPFLMDVIDDPKFADGSFTTTTIEQRYDRWSDDAPDELHVATVAAALLGRHGRASHADGGSGGRERIPGPWETLGGWRIGERHGGEDG